MSKPDAYVVEARVVHTVISRIRFWVDVEDCDEDPAQLVKEGYSWDQEELVVESEEDEFFNIKVMTKEDFEKEYGTPHERQHAERKGDLE
jgi:hypothetical protein